MRLILVILGGFIFCGVFGIGLAYLLMWCSGNLSKKRQDDKKIEGEGC